MDPSSAKVGFLVDVTLRFRTSLTVAVHLRDARQQSEWPLATRISQCTIIDVM